MAKYRVVNTRFWDDPYVAELNPTEKLVFLYLLTNALTTIGGVYELPLKRAAFDVGLPVKELKSVFEKLERDGKVVWQDGWVALVNFVKHQSLNPKVRRGIEIEHEKAPPELVARLNLPAEFFSATCDSLSYSNRNSKSNTKGLFSPDFSTEEARESRKLEERIRDLARRKRIE